MGRSDDDRFVLTLSQHAYQRTRELCPIYGGDASPLHEGQIADLLRHAGCQVETWSFSSSAGGFAITFQGRPGIAINQQATRPARELCTLHELYHVLMEDAGNPVTGPVYFSDRGYLQIDERASDLFALINLCPAWALKPLKGRPDRELRREVAQNVADHAEGWPLRRLVDRARLRVLLFRQHGI